MFFSLILVSCFLTVFANPQWNDLKIKWGANYTDPRYFYSLPRDQVQAANDGWVLSKKDCSRADGTGNRYYKDDNGVQVVFGRDGTIAGISATIPKNLPYNFPSKTLQRYFQDEGEFYTFTAYFSDPSTICSSDRQSTGDRLVIKGQSAEMNIPLSEAEVLAEKKWTKGYCFMMMGTHYWRDISGKQINEETNKDDFFPMFLLYNKGRLNGFGFAFNTFLESPRYEHPLVPVIQLFMYKTPKFFADKTQSDGLTTLHIYLDDTPHLNNC